MSASLIEQQLLERLKAISELRMSGFSARPGLMGDGVTILNERTYFGSWRTKAGALVWTYATVGDAPYFAPSVDAAVRHTMMLILRHLEHGQAGRKTAAYIGAVR